MYYWVGIWIWIGIFLCQLGATEKKKVCLNMIIKDESKVIQRSLASVKPVIDYWVIVDTGSTDRTQEIVKEFMKDIPGELHERPWVNFEHNRNEALKLANGKGDYLLFIDADEEFLYSKDFKKSDFNLDSYLVTISLGENRYYRKQIVNNHLNWKWVGVLHEYLTCPQAKSEGIWEGVVNYCRPAQGCRSRDNAKYEKDALVLEKALEKEPYNSRYVFYLAQSYRDAEKPELAIKNYLRRISMGGWDQEVFWSKYQIALLQEGLGKDAETVINAYMDAYNYRPTRVEPLCRLATYFRTKENYLLGYLVASQALSLPKTEDILMVETWAYDYWLQIEKLMCAQKIGKYEEVYHLAVQLLSSPNCPERCHSYVFEALNWIMGAAQ